MALSYSLRVLLDAVEGNEKLDERVLDVRDYAVKFPVIKKKLRTCLVDFVLYFGRSVLSFYRIL